MAVALVLLLLLPHPPALELAIIFGIAITGSWLLRTGLRVNRERQEAVRGASSPDDRADDRSAP